MIYILLDIHETNISKISFDLLSRQHPPLEANKPGHCRSVLSRLIYME